MKQLIKTAGEDSSHSEREIGNLDPSECSPSITTKTMSLAGRSSGGEPPTETEPIHLINPARGGEQFLVVRGDFNQKLKAPLSLNSSRSKRPLRVQLTRGGQQLQGRSNSGHWGHGTVSGMKCASLHSNILKSAC
ncbi:unnamed protein product [Sphagnum jensenii]|uniref:Uncharacterized protein n=1 Tax=Sphagnum jensenii TaxID=128206 RepID=A0ABP1A0X5_9BRYO